MAKTDVLRKRAKTAALAAGLTWCAVSTMADGPGHSFTSIESPFTQELFGVTADPVVVNGADGRLGSVAFAPDGDVWAAECGGPVTRLHRFDRQNPGPDGHGGVVRSESVVDPLATFGSTPDGCGTVNHPDRVTGFDAVYVNTPSGLWPMDADSGMPIFGGAINSSTNGGNGRGIDIAPSLDLSSPHVVYVGADCDATLTPWASACTLWDYEPATYNTLAFARFNRSATESLESLYFSPDGSTAFVSYRDGAAQGLAVVARPAALLDPWTLDDSQVVRRIPMTSMPVGLAFRASGDFAVTLNDDGTMTKLVFASGNMGAAPTQTTFASGGFRGGLLRVGADGCIYAPQGRLAGGTSGVRFGDDAVAPSDSIVRICSEFAPSPGVAGAPWSPEPGSISGAAFADWNRDGIKDTLEPGLAGVAISLTGASTASAVTGGSGGYTLANVDAGLYSVSAPLALGGLSGNPTPVAVNVAPGAQRSGIDFPYTESNPPACTPVTDAGRVTFTVRDADSGVRRIRVRALQNIEVSIQGGQPITVPSTVEFSSLATGDVTVTATRGDSAQAASVEIEAEDAFATPSACVGTIPADTTQPPTKEGTTPIRKYVTGSHRHVVVTPLSQTMRHVTIRSGRHGLRRVDVYVNQHRYRVDLGNRQLRLLDVGTSLEPGTHNRITLVGWGRLRESAVVTISDRP